MQATYSRLRMDDEAYARGAQVDSRNTKRVLYSKLLFLGTR